MVEATNEILTNLIYMMLNIQEILIIINLLEITDKKYDNTLLDKQDSYRHKQYSYRLEEELNRLSKII